MSIQRKKILLNKWFSEEKEKGFDTSKLTQEELLRRLRKTRDELWEEKCKFWFE